MMKHVSRVVTCYLIMVCCLFSRQLKAETSVTEEIKQAEKKWIAAVVGQDRGGMDGILAKELIYTHSTGLVEDKGQYIAAVTSGNQKYDSIEYEAPAIQVYGSTAVVATKVVMKGSTKGQPFNNQLRLLHVWVKQGAKWMLVAHQTTRLP